MIEAVAEDGAVRATVLRLIEAVAAPEAIIATNTSGLPIVGLTAALARPEWFIGLHFFSPVDRMARVEVVVGRDTSSATTTTALGWLHRLGKQPIIVRDSPGSFTPRIFTACLDEAVARFAEGVDPESIEAAARSAGLAIGPLAVLDETGLALNWQQARQASADGLDDLSCRALAWPVPGQDGGARPPRAARRWRLLRPSCGRAQAPRVRPGRLYPRRADPPSRADIEQPTDHLLIQRHLVAPF